MIDSLRRQTQVILDGERADSPEVQSACRALFSHFRNGMSFDAMASRSDVSGGLAISPEAAAFCMNDVVRLATFFRGSHAAVLSLLASDPERDEPLVFIENCSGPYAPIALMLAATFPEDQLHVGFGDINQCNVDSALSLFEFYGLEDRLLAAKQGDAAGGLTFFWERPDIMMIEAAAPALLRESQGAVMFNQLRDLRDLEGMETLMIPDSIAVSVVDEKSREQVELVDMNAQWREAVMRSSHHEARKRLSVGGGFNTSGGHFFLSTTVKVFGGHVIGPDESQLTTTLPLGLRVAEQEEPIRVEVSYRMGDSEPRFCFD